MNEVIDFGLGISAVGVAGVLYAAWKSLPLLIIAIIVGMALRRRLPASLHFGLWMLVIVRLLLPISLESPWSLQNPLQLVAEAASTQWQQWTAPAAQPRQVVHREMQARPLSAAPTPGVNFERTTEVVAYETAGSSGSGFDWEYAALVALVMTWPLGVVIFATRSLLAYRRFAIRVRESEGVSAAELRDLVDEAARRMQIKRQPQVKMVAGLGSPAVFGWYRPVLCLPSDLLHRFSHEQIGLMLRHEFAHVQRRDTLWVSLATITRSLHWFNPFAWYAAAQLRSWIERAADERALRGESDAVAIEYGRLLLTCAQDSSRDSCSVLGLLSFFGSKRLQRRIQWIALAPRSRNRMTLALFAVLLVGLAIVGLSDAATLPQAPGPYYLSDDQWPAPPSQVAQIAPVKIQRDPVSVDIRGLRDSLLARSPKLDVNRFLNDYFSFLGGGSLKIEGDDLVGELSADELRSLGAIIESMEQSGLWQVVVELRVISGDRNLARNVHWTSNAVAPTGADFLSPVRLQNFAPELKLNYSGSEIELVETENQGTERPMRAARIAEPDLEAMVLKATSDPRANLLMAPKVTTFQGQGAIIAECTARPFITEVSSDGARKVDVVPDGWGVEFASTVEPSGSIHFRCHFEEAHVEHVGSALLPDGDPIESLDENSDFGTVVQVPHRLSARGAFDLELKPSESLIIAVPEVAQDESNDEQAEPLTRYYIFTPRPIDDNSMLEEYQLQE